MLNIPGHRLSLSFLQACKKCCDLLWVIVALFIFYFARQSRIRGRWCSLFLNTWSYFSSSLRSVFFLLYVPCLCLTGGFREWIIWYHHIFWGWVFVLWYFVLPMCRANVLDTFVISFMLADLQNSEIMTEIGYVLIKTQHLCSVLQLIYVMQFLLIFAQLILSMSKISFHQYY